MLCFLYFLFIFCTEKIVSLIKEVRVNFCFCYAVKDITVCKALDTLLQDFWKVLVPSFFLPHQTWKIGSLFFVPDTLRHFLRAIFRNYCLYDCKKTVYYHLSMICTINAQRGLVFCCGRQIFEDTFAKFSLKSSQLLTFSISKIQLEKLGSPFILKIFS